MGKELTAEYLSQIADLRLNRNNIYKWIRGEGLEVIYIAENPSTEHHRHLKEQVDYSIVDAGILMPLGNREVSFGDESETLKIKEDNPERPETLKIFRKLAEEAQVTHLL